MASHHQSRRHSAYAHPDRPHAVHHDARNNPGAWEDGMAAYEVGDYQKTFRLWKPLAEQGDARAQGMLGSLYAGGKGVPEDDAKAVHWFTKCDDVVEQQLGNNMA